MLVAIVNRIIVEVKDRQEGEEAGESINSGLEQNISRGFPHGEIVAVKVDDVLEVSDQEAEDEGWTE